MPFTAQELENITNSVLEFHMDPGKVYKQTVQNKPLLNAMRSMQKTFPSGKENITLRVSGDVTTTIMGYTHDDQVSYQNPANTKKATFPWKETHAGLEVTLTELKEDGISVVDSTTGKSTTEHSGREKTALANLLDEKMWDMKEGWDRGENTILWRDGTQDSLVPPGIQSFILTYPTSATVVAGIDQSNVTWWRNRSNGNIASGLKSGTGIDVGTPSSLNLATALQREFRQLRRYGSPRHMVLCGSDWLDAMERELRSKGDFTQDGWAKSGKIDMSVADVAFKGVGFEYDPTLDDLGYAKYAYVIDKSAIYPMVMEGEDMKRHNPARPHDRYVIYKAVTKTFGLVCKMRNTSGVYWIA